MSSLLARSFPRGLSSTLRHRTAVSSHRWASVLVVSDPLDASGTLPVAAQSAVTAALQWLAAKGDATSECVLLTTGGTTPPAAVPAGVTHTLHATTTQPLVVETAAAAIQQAVADVSPDIIMGTATKWGSSVIPRAAALLTTSPLSDVTQIVDDSE